MPGRTFTAGEISDRVRSLGCLENLDGEYSDDAPSAPSSGTLLRFIDLAHRRAWEAYSDADEGWHLRRQTYTLVAGSASYALPTDFHRLRAMEVSLGSSSPGFERLQRANALDDMAIGPSSGGWPTAYRIVDEGFELLPTPGSGYQVRLSYTPEAARISSSLQSIPGDDGFDDVVAYRTLVMTAERQEKDTREWSAMATETEARFRDSVRRRDRASPMRMRGRNELASRRRRFPYGP